MSSLYDRVRICALVITYRVLTECGLGDRVEALGSTLSLTAEVYCISFSGETELIGWKDLLEWLLGYSPTIPTMTISQREVQELNSC